jgi:hypothetical protein
LPVAKRFLDYAASRRVPRLRFSVKTTRTTIADAIVSDDVIRPSARPPSAYGFVRVSPRVAPSGRVRTYAHQKRIFEGRFVK